MRPRHIVAMLLIVIGLVSLLLGGFSWTKEKTVLDIGPIEATTRDDVVTVLEKWESTAALTDRGSVAGVDGPVDVNILFRREVVRR